MEGQSPLRLSALGGCHHSQWSRCPAWREMEKGCPEGVVAVESVVATRSEVPQEMSRSRGAG